MRHFGKQGGEDNHGPKTIRNVGKNAAQCNGRGRALFLRKMHVERPVRSLLGMSPLQTVQLGLVNKCRKFWGMWGSFSINSAISKNCKIIKMIGSKI